MTSDALDDINQTFMPKEVAKDVMPDLSMAIWKQKSGPHGEFELASVEDNKNNAGFDRLRQSLTEHAGKMTVNQFFVWSMPDGSIGRKQRTR
jgi:hypothetical protein